jgi:hypothetical protein
MSNSMFVAGAWWSAREAVVETAEMSTSPSLAAWCCCPASHRTVYIGPLVGAGNRFAAVRGGLVGGDRVAGGACQRGVRRGG